METPVVVVISREMVKPCSETPDHLKKFKLSYLDQLSRLQHFPLLFFIQSDQTKGLTVSNHPQIFHNLKHSLSQTLPLFYPLAGRFHDHSVVDCNDEGVDFVGARTRARLANAIQDPDMGHLKQYLPMDPTTQALPKSGALLSAQITFFDCGGVAIGICFSHRIADFTSVLAFVNSWAATCRGQGDTTSDLSFDLAAYFPARELPTDRFSEPPSTDRKLVTKKVLFNKQRLDLLKQAADSVVKNSTRVEVVTAFIWRSFLKAAEMKNPKARTDSAALHIVNLRPREKILENVFGNCTMSSVAFSGAGDGGGEGVEELGDLVGKVKASIRRISEGECISEARRGDVYWAYHKEVFGGFARGEMERCSFSSWSRFPVYEVDFGWGKPVWWCATPLPVKNLTILVGTRCGRGIEAWVNMDDDAFQMLQNDIQLCFHSAHV